MAESKQDTGSPSLTTLRGGESFTVRKIDGTTQEVLVRQPPIRELDGYFRRFNDVQQLVEYVCEQPEKWGDGLTDESLFDLYEKVRALNDPRLDRWLKIQGSAVKSLMGLIPPVMQAALKLSR